MSNQGRNDQSPMPLMQQADSIPDPLQLDEPIFMLAEECEQAFSLVHEQFSSTMADVIPLLEEYQQRFAAWTAYLGVFAKPSICLDRRLKGYTELGDIVLRLLGLLKLKLSQISEYLESRQAPHARQSSGLNEELSGAFGAIDGAIGRLNRMGIAIRHSSKSSISSGPSDVDGYNSFKAMALILVQVLYPRIQEDLQELLSASMGMRFDRIMSKQIRQGLLETRRPQQSTIRLHTDISSISEDAPPQPTPKQPTPNRGGPSVRGPNPPNAVNHRISALRSEPSSINPSLLWRNLNTPFHLDGGASSVTFDQTGYPDPPKPVGAYIKCEWCSETWLKSHFEGRQWGAHVDRDLKPYICLSEMCAEPVRSFETLQIWHGHMVSDHGENWHRDIHPSYIWMCAVCNNSVDGFLNAQQLDEHIQAIHNFPEYQRRAILSQSRIRLKRRPDVCPLCCMPVEEDIAATKARAARQFELGDSGKRQQEHSSSQSIPKRARKSSQPSGAHQTPEPEASETTSYKCDLARKSIMARHVAVHLQGLMCLTLRLMAIRQPSEGSKEFGSGATESVDDQSRKAEIQDGSHIQGTIAELGGDSNLDEDAVPEGDLAFDPGALVPNSEDPHWDLVLEVFGKPPQPPADPEPDQRSGPPLVTQTLGGGLESLELEVGLDITVCAAPDRGYCVAETMYNIYATANDVPESLRNDDRPLGLIIDQHIIGDGFKKRWLPVDKLFELVNPYSVHKALSQALPEYLKSPAELNHYVAEICSPFVCNDPVTKKQIRSSRRCIFAVLALSGRVKDAPYFVDSNICDEDLPLEGRNTELGTELVSRVKPFKRMALPKGWDFRIAQSLENQQPYILSPFFDLASKNDVPFHDLDDSCMLPFVENFYNEHRQVGYHGTVFKVRIHPAHHNFPPGDNDEKNPYFAVKELSPKDNDSSIDFAKEVTAWVKSVGVARHRHIVRLLATWHQNQSWHLLFGWAEGNLRDYWKAHPVGCPHTDLGYRHIQSKWVVEQCLGIAHGLGKIHTATSTNSDDGEIENYGIHGGIKPENILRFKDRNSMHGLLVICDFGFNIFHSRRPRPAATREGTNPTYHAPEYDTIERVKDGISRAGDVWALGCVYLEFITWYLLGFGAVDDTFPSHRISEDRGELIPSDKFFVCVTVDGPDSIGVIVKPCVYEWIRGLRTHGHCNKLCHDFLDIIEKDLLVVDPKKRIDCLKLSMKLDKIYQKAQRNEYCLEGRPVTGPAGSHVTQQAGFFSEKMVAEPLQWSGNEASDEAVRSSAPEEVRQPANQDDAQELHLGGDEVQMALGETISGQTQPPPTIPELPEGTKQEIRERSLESLVEDATRGQ